MHRKLQQENTSLNAKKEFIESKYDYTTNVNDMNLEIFKNVVDTNVKVNATVGDFVGRVTDVKDQVAKILQAKMIF